MHASFRRQTSIYLGKCFRLFRSEKGWTNFVSTVIILLLVCCVTGDDMFRTSEDTRTGVFALVCACVWIGIFNSIRSVCSERAIIKREHRTGLRISSYILAHVIYEASICLAESLIVSVIVVIRNHANLNPYGVLMPTPVELCVDCFLILYCSDLLGLFVSCIVPTENLAMTVMPFILIAEMVFANVIFDLQGIIHQISALMISRWGMAMLCVTANINEMSWLYERGNDFSFETGHMIVLWLTMLFFCLVFIALSILFLSRVDRDSR